MIRKVHSGVFPGRKIVANAVYRQADPPLEFGTLKISMSSKDSFD